MKEIIAIQYKVDVTWLTSATFLLSPALATLPTIPLKQVSPTLRINKLQAWSYLTFNTFINRTGCLVHTL